MPTRKALIVSYFFPPTNTIGALRVGKFAKYLPEFGWEPWILTLQSGLLNISEDLTTEVDEEHVLRADLGRFLTPRLLNRRSGKNIEAAVNGMGARSSLKSRLWTTISS